MVLHRNLRLRLEDGAFAGSLPPTHLKPESRMTNNLSTYWSGTAQPSRKIGPKNWKSEVRLVRRDTGELGRGFAIQVSGFGSSESRLAIFWEHESSVFDRQPDTAHFPLNGP